MPNFEDHEARIGALEKARHDLEDSLLVMAHLENRQSMYLKEQAAAIDDLRRRDEAHRKMNEETDRRIADLVSAVGKLIARLPPPQA